MSSSTAKKYASKHYATPAVVAVFGELYRKLGTIQLAQREMIRRYRHGEMIGDVNWEMVWKEHPFLGKRLVNLIKIDGAVEHIKVVKINDCAVFCANQAEQTGYPLGIFFGINNDWFRVQVHRKSGAVERIG